MESYFIVKNETLIEKVKEYESMRKKINNAFIEFAKEYEIETNEYYMLSDVLKIVPTAKDRMRFKEQLKTDGKTFKKYSSMNKVWTDICKEKNIKQPYKPTWELAELIDNGIYRFKSRLFSLGETVYGSFEADICFNLPQEHFTELKASEFYKTIEDYEKELARMGE